MSIVEFEIEVKVVHQVTYIHSRFSITSGYLNTVLSHMRREGAILLNEAYFGAFPRATISVLGMPLLQQSRGR
jgi:hypothetical protein